MALATISVAVAACFGCRRAASEISSARSPLPEAAGLVRLKVLELPGGAPGIGFDDLRYSSSIDEVLVPAGRSGRLDLVRPRTLEVRAIPGFSEVSAYSGGHDDGVTSADVGFGSIFATDRTNQRLSVIDPKSYTVTASIPLAQHPDYVRVVDAKRQVWVTQPDADQIEVFSLGAGARYLSHSGTISVEGGPESLAVDRARSRAYTHLWRGRTAVIDLTSRAIVSRWDNGCHASRGIALDVACGKLVSACAEGKLTVVDLASERLVSELLVGGGVDVIDFEPEKRHVYVPSGKTATLVVARLATDGTLIEIGRVATAPGAHSVVSDRQGKIYVSDPVRGSLLIFRDELGAPSRWSSDRSHTLLKN